MLQNETNARLVNATKKDPGGDVYFGTIDVLHEAVHEGKMHTVSYRALAVADNGYLRLRIKASATKDVHARIAWASEGKSSLKSFVGTTYSNNGTAYTPFNRRTSLPNSITALVYVDPTINVLGTQRGDDFIGTGGAAASRVGGTGEADIETIISAGTDLLLEIQNLRGSASDLNFIANIYERATL
jgi:hypothetical protein